MLFNSWGYLLFLVLAVPTHWLLPHRWRIGALAAYSVLFYSMWRWEFSLLVLFSACVDYWCSRRIHASDRPPVRRAWLLVSLIINLGLLVVFKYTYFIYDNIRFLGDSAGLDTPSLSDLGLKIILPLGISFYTFQTISYTIDVYRRVIKPADHFLSFLTYVTFWPQLIAGPILRAVEVIPQLEEERRFSFDDFSSGLYYVIAGLFKKVVLADTIAGMVDVAFAADCSQMTAFDVWVSTFLFGFQIYFDFSGYSAIAIGSAMMVGLHFPQNFNWPYMSVSPKDFWNRWHISLSAWIRDYLYLPLTGQQFQTRSTGGIAVAGDVSQHRRTRALLLTWFIMGLWHGAGWTFALWGMYHAMLILVFRAWKPLRTLPQRVPVVAWGVMLLVAMAGWIPFRAASVSQSLTMFGKILNPLAYHLSGRVVEGYAYLVTAALTVGMIGVFLVERRQSNRPMPRAAVLVTVTAAVAVMVGLILPLMRVVQQFIYFQF